jgi:hypothetical protein
MAWVVDNDEATAYAQPYDKWANGRLIAHDSWQDARDSLYDAACEWLDEVADDTDQFTEVVDDAHALVDILGRAKPNQEFKFTASYGYRAYRVWQIVEVK